DRLDAELFLIDTALLVGQRVAVKAGGDLLLQSGLRQQVASQLLDDELVIGQVAVESADQPVAPAPGERTAGVLLVAIAVGVARDIEPVPRPPLAVMRRRKETVNKSLVGVGAPVAEEGIDLGRCRRQAGQVEAETANQRGAVRLGRGRKSLLLQPRQDKAVDVIAHPG